MEAVAKSGILNTKVSGVELGAQVGAFKFVCFFILEDQTLDDARTSVVQKTADMLEDTVYWALGRVDQPGRVKLVVLMETERSLDCRSTEVGFSSFNC